MATALAPLSTHSVGAVERQRALPACSAVADGVSRRVEVRTTDHRHRTDDALRDAPRWSSSFASGGCFRLAAGPYPALVGLNGLSAHHVEGDDTTPIGLFGFQSTMYGVLPNPGVAYRVPPTRLRRLVGRTVLVAALQPLRARALRHETGLRRRLRGTVADRPLLRLLRGHRLQPTPDRPGTAARRSSSTSRTARDRRLREHPGRRSAPRPAGACDRICTRSSTSRREQLLAP